MSQEIPKASLASMEPYAVPAGAHLEFRYIVYTTDGFMRGDVSVVLPNGGGSHVVAENVPVTGTSSRVKAMGDFGKLFPDPIPVAPASNGE